MIIKKAPSLGLGLGLSLGLGGINKGFDPRDYSGLATWFDGTDADSFGIRAPNWVTSWTDVLGFSVYQVVEANQFSYLGSNKIFGAGSSQNLISALDFDVFDGLNSYTIILLARFLAADAPYSIFSLTDASSQHGVLVESSATNQLRFLHRFPYTGGGNSFITVGGNVDTNSTQVMICKRDAVAGTHSISIDGTEESQALVGSGFDSALSRLTIGSLLQTGGRWFFGYLNQLLIYNRALNSTELSYLTTFLNSKK